MPILLTGGCSFSECIKPDVTTWPKILAGYLPHRRHVSEGMGSQGNGLIARRIQHRCHQLLKTHDADDLLVGIMWTGTDRWEFYQQPKVDFVTNIDSWQINPYSWSEHDPGGWVITNPHWLHHLNEPIYRYYYDPLWMQSLSLEHIVHTQRFLKQKGIRYFMTKSFSNCINPDFKQNPVVEYLWDDLDESCWLPVKSELEWLEDQALIAKGANFHPKPEQHRAFVDQIIMPWLEQKGWID